MLIAMVAGGVGLFGVGFLVGHGIGFRLGYDDCWGEVQEGAHDVIDGLLCPNCELHGSMFGRVDPETWNPEASDYWKRYSP